MNKKYIFIIAGIAVAILLFFLLKDSELKFDNRHFEVEADTTVVDSATLNLHKPKIFYGYNVDSMVLVEGRVKRNQNLSEILNEYNISHQKIHQLSIASKPVFDIRKIGVNKKYTLICYPDSLQTAKAMIYEPSATEFVIFDLDDSVTVKREEKEIILQEKALAGIIEMSLAKYIPNLPDV